MLSIGRALFREGLWEHAERFFRRAVAADEKSSDAAADLAATVDRALTTLSRLQLDPTPILGLTFEAMDQKDPRFQRRLLGLFLSAGRSALPWLDKLAPSRT